MKILICGNINSGKSHAVEKLHGLLPTYEIAKIDDYRKEHGDGTIDGEILARKKFIDRILHQNNIIFEFTGLGSIGIELQEKLEPKSFITLYINTPLNICIKRLTKKDFSLIPYPKFNENIESTIKRIDNELEGRALNKLWESKALQILELENQTDFSSIPLLHFEYTIGVVKELKLIDEINDIISFGSLARKELTKLSDIDLFVTTELSVTDVYNKLLETLTPNFADTTKNKITLYFDNILIEIVVVKKIEDIISFYNNLTVSDVQNTIIKGDYNTRSFLKIYIKKLIIDKEYEKSETIKRLMYFILSMDNIVKKEDDYKFFFHNNIIIHEIVKLLHFAKDKYVYSYLPRKALNYCKEIDIKTLTYDFEKDKKEHIKLLKQATKVALELVGCQEKKYFNLL